MSDQASESERRRHRRVAADLPVRLSTLDPERDAWSGRPFFRASKETCANLSRGGMFVRTDEPISPGRRVLLEVSMPTGQRLEAIGRVAWSKTVLVPPSIGQRSREAGIGVEFLGGAPDEFSALERYLDAFDGEADDVPAKGNSA